ncbi:MAG: hypothetical protein ACOVMP_00665 [Chthoniobacterales bacterium]
MNKEALRAAILNHLRDQFESRLQASKKTRSAGNDSESKAEGKYDTLSIEENYLADGLAKQAHDAAAEAAEIESMPLPAFGPDDPIDLGALVELQFADGTEWFFMASAAGGLEVIHFGKTITVLSLESPLGSRLIGARVGDSITTPSARILAVV